jgi:undecaprenyl-diphosphatase
MRTNLNSSIGRTDRLLTTLVQRAVPSWLGSTLQRATDIGTPTITISLLVAAALLSAVNGDIRLGLLTALAAGAAVVPGLLKYLFHRTRPDTLYVSVHNPHGTSFPSGHSAGSVIAFGYFAWLSIGALPALGAAVLVLGVVVLIGLIGISRVWLGAHYPTDVLGGWIIGALLLAGLIRISTAWGA